jgi:ATP-dependent RNA helicase DOB1
MTKDTCVEYVALRDELGKLEHVVHAAVCEPRICLPFLTAGRIVRVQAGVTDWGWGVVLTAQFKPPHSGIEVRKYAECFMHAV